jgi:hypothetical protein
MTIVLCLLASQSMYLEGKIGGFNVHRLRSQQTQNNGTIYTVYYTVAK